MTVGEYRIAYAATHAQKWTTDHLDRVTDVPRDVIEKASEIAAEAFAQALRHELDKRGVTIEEDMNDECAGFGEN